MSQFSECLACDLPIQLQEDNCSSGDTGRRDRHLSSNSGDHVLKTIFRGSPTQQRKSGGGEKNFHISIFTECLKLGRNINI